MSRSRNYRIAAKERKINRRKELIRSVSSFRNEKIEYALSGEKDGLLSKCHYGALGGNRKTKTKNAYASYRHKGGYGKAVLYSRHDMAQIAGMKLDLADYPN